MNWIQRQSLRSNSPRLWPFCYTSASVSQCPHLKDNSNGSTDFSDFDFENEKSDYGDNLKEDTDIEEDEADTGKPEAADFEDTEIDITAPDDTVEDV